jgi:hypothetical protein
VQLRTLQLHKTGLHNDIETERRLLAWPSHRPYAAPLLQTVRLFDVFCSEGTTFVNDAFQSFAWRKGLKQLWLGSNCDSHQGPVSLATIETLLSATDYDRSESHAFNLGHSDSHHQAQRGRPLPGRRPYEDLEELAINLASPAPLPPLVMLVPKLMRLYLDMGRTDQYAVDDETPPSIFPTLKSLPQLHVLHVVLPYGTRILSADLRELHGLTKLRELCLRVGTADDDITDDEVVALLRALHRLRVLGLSIYLPGVSQSVFSAIGMAQPFLRQLTLEHPKQLLPAPNHNEAHGERPLFPHLEALELAPPIPARDDLHT